MGSPEVNNSAVGNLRYTSRPALRTAPIWVNDNVGDGSAPVQTEEPVGNRLGIHFILLFPHQYAMIDRTLLGSDSAHHSNRK
jgi:hypothetical protein